MIDTVIIENFKSIVSRLQLELRPLTVLVGPNGGGKSSIMEAIYIAAGNQPQLLGYSLESLPSFGKSDVKARVSLHVGEPTKAVQRCDITKGNWNLPNEGEVALIGREIGGKTYFISSIRGQVPATQGAGGVAGWVGTHGENLLTLLTEIFGSIDNEDIQKKITEWSDRFGLRRLHAGHVKGALTSDYIDIELGAKLKLNLASGGTRQVLTIIVHSFQCPRRSVNLIEEPEISLHPKGQLEVARLFAAAIQEEKQFIVSSHSPFFVLGLATIVQEKLVKPQDIAVYHVEKKAKIGTTAQKLELTEDGYVKGWIPSFEEEERKVMETWAKTLREE